MTTLHRSRTTACPARCSDERQRRSAATAQTDFPRRTVKFVVPVPPGNMLDSMPRIIGDKLSARWSQPVIVENRPGAASNLGAEMVWKSEPDGYTLLVSPPGPLVVSQHVYPKLGFDPAAFVPVSHAGAVSVHPDRQSEGAGLEFFGTDRARQGEPGQDHLRLPGRQQHPASGDGAVRGRRRNPLRARPLSRPGARHARSARGPYRRDLRHAGQRPAPYRQRQRRERSPSPANSRSPNCRTRRRSPPRCQASSTPTGSRWWRRRRPRRRSPPGFRRRLPRR